MVARQREEAVDEVGLAHLVCNAAQLLVRGVTGGGECEASRAGTNDTRAWAAGAFQLPPTIPHQDGDDVRERGAPQWSVNTRVTRTLCRYTHRQLAKVKSPCYTTYDKSSDKGNKNVSVTTHRFESQNPPSGPPSTSPTGL